MVTKIRCCLNPVLTTLNKEDDRFYSGNIA
nr:MAG TPA: hypothetical protein [Caudoviricetes sp.]